MSKTRTHKTNRKTTVGEYLITRLREAGVRHVFGIPGDYVLTFYDQMVESPLKVIGTSSEQGAAFAADGYARVNGIGALCVTYTVGGLNTVNAVAGAYAEKSPVIVISGAPGLDERKETAYLHHRVRDFHAQRKVFEQVTVASVAIEDPDDAPDLIDETIAECLKQRRPVYIELPRDIVKKKCAAPKKLKKNPEPSNPDALAEAVAEAAKMLKKAKRPAILAGVELHRFGLQDPLLKLVEGSGYPVSATLLGKSVISELHPNYVGVYEGAMGREPVRKTIESADCLLILGAFMTDINLGIYTADLNVGRTINATSEQIQIKHHHYQNVRLDDFIEGLQKAIPKAKTPAKVHNTQMELPAFKVKPSEPMTIRRLFARLNEFIGDDMIVIADVGDSLFGAVDLTIHRRTEFLSPAYYTSMGFAIPAGVGAQMAKKKLRPLILVGDGAFQMTGMEISSYAKYGLNPIIIVLNNKGYTTERFINEGPYNDIHNWAYHRWTEIVHYGWGTEVYYEGEMEGALELALHNKRSLSIINVHLDKMDRSNALERLGERMSKQVDKKGKKS